MVKIGFRRPGYFPAMLEMLESVGPWPFITRRVFRRPDGSPVVWRSRHHRKALNWIEPGEAWATAALLRRCLWMPGTLNWWIGIIFALGSFLFAAGCVLVLWPTLMPGISANPVFFAGSIPFTVAAYLQLYQAANAGNFSAEGKIVRPPHRVIFGWDPRNAGWVSCALQFLGTLLFNANTFDAMVPGWSVWVQDMLVWLPNLIGSVFFLVSGYIAYIETCHTHWKWWPAHLSWWVVFVNLLGCLGFMVSAVLAYLPLRPLDFDGSTLSVIFTLLGAIGFFVGSLLMLPEAAA